MATYPDNPHFAFPFRFTVSNKADVIEQDSPEEVNQCVEIILRYPRGYRVDLPEFGIRDQSFLQNGPDLNEIHSAIARWEPRASVDLSRGERSLLELTDVLAGHAVIELNKGG
jgi:phage baseplate assembly protein W